MVRGVSELNDGSSIKLLSAPALCDSICWLKCFSFKIKLLIRWRASWVVPAGFAKASTINNSGSCGVPCWSGGWKGTSSVEVVPTDKFA